MERGEEKEVITKLGEKGKKNAFKICLERKLFQSGKEVSLKENYTKSTR